jgi:hypothetical protein
MSSAPFKVDLLEYAGEPLRGLDHIWRVHQLGGGAGGHETLLRRPSSKLISNFLRKNLINFLGSKG